MRQNWNPLDSIPLASPTFEAQKSENFFRLKKVAAKRKKC
jgi:hypothetical protein